MCSTPIPPSGYSMRLYEKAEIYIEDRASSAWNWRSPR